MVRNTQKIKIFIKAEDKRANEMAKKKKIAKKRPTFTLVAVFWTLVGISAVILGMMTVPAFRSLMRSYFLILTGTFFLLGVALLFLALKQKMEKTLKKFLILTGASAVGFFVFSVLHNLFYAFGILTEHIIVLKYLMEFLHVASFLIAIFVCPIAFLVGVVGSIVMFIKNKKK